MSKPSENYHYSVYDVKNSERSGGGSPNGQIRQCDVCRKCFHTKYMKFMRDDFDYYWLCLQCLENELPEDG